MWIILILESLFFGFIHDYFDISIQGAIKENPPIALLFLTNSLEFKTKFKG